MSSYFRKCYPTTSFFLNRFVRFFPYTFVAFLLSAITIRGIIATDFSFRSLIVVEDLWEILLINMSGMNVGAYPLNVPSWTISTILIVQFLVYCLIYYDKKLFINVILPLSIIFTINYYLNLQKAGLRLWVVFTTSATLRAWFEICLGYYCVKAAQNLRNIEFNTRGKIILTAVELLAHMLVFSVMATRNSRHWLMLTLVLYFVALTIELSGNSLFCQFISKFRWAALFAPASLAVYLIQQPILSYFRWKYTDPYEMYTYSPQFIGIVIIAAVFYYALGNFLLSYLNC